MDERTTATIREVEQAINSLSHADLLRLRDIAKTLVWSLGRARRGRDDSDLLHEAIASLLAGANSSGTGRRWSANVEFREALWGAMRSIASHWRDKFCREVSLDSELPNGGAETANKSSLEGTPSCAPTADAALSARQEVARIMHLFRHNVEATQVLRGWIGGMTGPEIMRVAGFTQQDYAAAVKRIRSHPLVLELGSNRHPRRKKNGK